jgi:hypothetical protein
MPRSRKKYRLEKMRAALARLGTLDPAGLHLLARLNLTDARHHLDRTTARKRAPKVSGSGSTLDTLVRRSLADLAAASVLRRPAGPILSRATSALLDLERAGAITAAESTRAFERILVHSQFTHSPHTKVKGTMSQHTDLPPELAAYSDGVSDDAAFTPEIIGCNSNGSIGGGLSDLAVGAHRGVPGYLLTAKGLRNPVVRRRVAENIKAMTPKLRRRVITRLRAALSAARSAARVSGEIRDAYPSIAGWGSMKAVDRAAAVSGPSVAVGRCPYAKVAGPLTP